MSISENEYSLTRKAVEDEMQPRGKYRLVRAAILISFAILIVQLGQLQIVQGARFKAQADQNRFRLIQTDALRGIIYDRSGKIIARNVPSFDISIVPADLDTSIQERVFKDLSLLLDVPIDTIIENKSEDVVEIGRASCRERV
jgi:cell division protein FtsI/penicillin-binding protein 2